MSVKERIKEIAKFKKMPVSALEKSCGLSNGYVNSIRKSISDKKLEQISNIFQDINPIWLKMGQGEMLKKDSPEKSPEGAACTACVEKERIIAAYRETIEALKEANLQLHLRLTDPQPNYQDEQKRKAG